MKALRLFILLNLVFCYNYAQNFNWVQRVGGLGNEAMSKSCTDFAGNTYVAFTGGGPQIYFNLDTLQVSGLNDLFLLKYDATGNEVWKLKIGGPNTSWIPAYSEAITDICFDSISNSIFMSGVYYSSCVIDTIPLNNAGTQQGFLTKIGVNGSVVWAKNFGSGFISAPRFDADKAGNLLMFFSVSNTGTLDTIPVTAGGYIGKLNTNVTIDFIKRICPSSVYNFKKIEVVNDLVFVYGGSNDSLTLDTIFLPDTSIHAHVISVWDTTGSILWARQSVNSQTGIGTMCTDRNGNIYTMASFGGPSIIFGSDTLFTNNLYGAFLLKYNKSGSLLWHRTFSTGGLGSYGALLDSEGEIYFTGAFLDSLNIDNFSIYSGTGIEELFIARFDTNGNCIGVRQAENSFGNDILQNNNGELFVVGSFRNTATFGSISIPSYGSSDIFLANLSAITGSGGGNERTYNNQLIIYANPNKGSFRIKLPDAITSLQNAFLIVYDQTGREVSRFALDNNSDTPRFEVNSATAGMYTVKLIQEEKVFVGRMVVE